MPVVVAVDFCPSDGVDHTHWLGADVCPLERGVHVDAQIAHEVIDAGTSTRRSRAASTMIWLPASSIMKNAVRLFEKSSTRAIASMTAPWLKTRCRSRCGTL